jgi:hypothetical protein
MGAECILKLAASPVEWPVTFSPKRRHVLWLYLTTHRAPPSAGIRHTMTDNVEDLILEHLRGIRSEVASLAAKVDTLTLRMGSLEEHVAELRRDLTLIHGDLAIMSHRLDLHERRLERIDKASRAGGMSPMTCNPSNPRSKETSWTPLI